MNEWGVVSVILVLISLLVTVSAPVIYIVRSFTKINAVLDNMLATMTTDRTMNQQSHDKLWAHNAEQDEMLNDHEARIRIMEKTE